MDGEETLVTDVGYDLITFTGVGVGTINQLEQSSGTEVSLTHTTEWEDSETKSSTTTINTTFTTSDSEDYVARWATCSWVIPRTCLMVRPMPLRW